MLMNKCVLFGLLVLADLTVYGQTIYYAAEDGDLAKVRSFLDQGADVNAISDRFKVSALHFAAQNGHTEVVELLLSRGSDVNIRAANENGFTPLHAASAQDHVDCARMLLDHGANPNAANNFGVTPVFWAVENGASPIIELLCRYKANINHQDNEGLTPLHWAITHGYLGCAKTLLTQGVNLAISSPKDGTPMQYALKKDSPQFVELLREYGGQLTSQAEIISYLENQLWLRGYGSGPVDGVADSTTIKAVKAFKRDARLVMNPQINLVLADHVKASSQYRYNFVPNVANHVKTNLYVSYETLKKWKWDGEGISVRGAMIMLNSGRGGSMQSVSWPDFPDGTSRLVDPLFGNLDVTGIIYVEPYGVCFVSGASFTIK